MPLRYIRRKVTADNVVTVAIATTAVTVNLAALASFPPVALPAAILLRIFQIIRNVQTNQEQCYELAFRCLSFLDLIKDQVADRSTRMPPTLDDALQKFANTLESIHSFLMSQAESKWRTRLIRKGTVQAALEDLNLKLNDAFSAFQIATLINIHYTVGDGPAVASPNGESAALSASYQPSLSNGADASSHVSDRRYIGPSAQSFRQSIGPLEPPSSMQPSADELIYDPPGEVVSSGIDGDLLLSEEELEELEDNGFRRYEQPHVSFKGGSRIKEGWWAGARQADIEGRILLAKTYEGSSYAAQKKWIRDVKILQNVFHPNLPQMVGFSGEECPTPFILLANVQTRLPQALVLDKIKNGTVAECVLLISRFYLDHMDAALYLQRQLNLSDSKIQDYVEKASFRIDGQQTLVMGLPPPEVDHWMSARNYDLAHSIRKAYLDLLPNRGMLSEKPYETKAESEPSIDIRRKINHLTHTLKAFLPGSHSSTHVSKLQELLSAYEDEIDLGPTATTPSLREIRTVALQLGANPPIWREPLVPAYKYSVGDLGYLEKGGDFSSFKLICNVLRDGHATFQTVQSQHGTQIQWHCAPPMQVPLDSFPCPGSRQGWAVALEPNVDYTVSIAHEERVDIANDIWKFLLNFSQYYAKKQGVEPEELILSKVPFYPLRFLFTASTLLVNRVGVDLRFRMKGPFVPFVQPHYHQPAPFSLGHQPHMLPMSHGFGHHQHTGHPFNARPAPPIIIYLSTSIDKVHEPTWSQSPVFDFESRPPHSIANCMIGTEGPLGFLNYVQLYAEDFLGAEGNSLQPLQPVLKRERKPSKSTKIPLRSAHVGGWTQSTRHRQSNTSASNLGRKHSSKK
ncbi:hypothetical protein DAEQUDRAFT_769357 [Daedalea quercina L-15889]|uniref:Mixed lineage kinase domain-containing protein n=1 Tax=Daedalea quercina L-15889 TaxID=1314783 RepID=A0A165LU84_9APHY|nr:hypothetical protein DAEQUDRAFT_769357 [Daedalea quercina L-15889]